MLPRPSPGNLDRNPIRLRLRRSLAYGLALVAMGLWGCVETYSDTRLQANLWVGSKFPRPSLVTPTPGLRPGDPGYFSHYELFARIGEAGMVRLATFLIQPSLHADNPCLQFLPDPFCVSVEGKECDPFINMQRYAPMEGIFVMVKPAVTFAVPPGFSAYGYDHYPSFNFSRWPDEIFLDPDLTPDASKLARDNLRQEVLDEFCASCLPEGYYLPDPTSLSDPAQGEIFGIVDGPDPRSGVGLGGIFMKLPGKLHGLTEMLVVRERDPSRLNAENYHRLDLLPGPDSQVLLVARKDESIGYIRDREIWGVTSVQLANPYGLAVFMRMVIFGDIEKDPVGI